ncbi:hypothetical protein SPRG_12464 [Saprolegnia parasitica CBS 223.65]|uniref:Cilia- and flagella-associated protein 36 n=1 Tax=Saprolegnia parasitica (strain CBS 223.65) TaxID=695850 RepID=A0A067BXB4_SAPPC|nr:hypothetical protein SPRG_12464 [Saprolegnia parasitica CBS 223.65]KDO21500.1 hypothetical protein SPRG_12464 [Saprolegnia parasitica CBS 223.65]|eukprot:XP_012207767.1 hypothetical protein SPRG_12464 [Saprolegnia parasitica CBS 223.65]
MSDFVVDAVAQFIEGDAWRLPLERFLAAHKAAFLGRARADEHTLGQHAVFSEFTEVAERLLEAMVLDLGCDPSTLLDALEDASKGVRAQSTRVLVQTLLSYNDFGAFCDRMFAYVRASAETATRHAIAQLASSEWVLQDVLARSLLEASDDDSLPAEDAPYVPWARVILEMTATYRRLAATIDGAEAEELRARITELQATLTKERLRVDLIVAQRLADENAQMRCRMRQLCGTSMDADAKQEATIGDVCDRLDAIPIELREIKQRCFAATNVRPAHLDELYLFLKDKVHHKQDLAQCEDEIASFVFARLTPTDAPIVRDILQWLLLESEAIELGKELQALSFASPRADAKDEDAADRWVQTWSDHDMAYYYVNSVLGTSQWEPPQAKDGSPILGFYDEANNWQPYAFGSANVHATPSEMAPDAKALMRQDDDDDAAATTLCSDALTGDVDRPVALASTDTDHANRTHAVDDRLASSSLPSDVALLDMEASLQRVLQEHADESRKLELTLQVEQARQAQDIQRRKAQRRQERQMRRSSKPHEPTSVPTVLPAPAHLSVCLPEGRKVDLMQLLSETDEEQRRSRRGLPGKSGGLNVTSLMYLAKKIAPKSKYIDIEETYAL